MTQIQYHTLVCNDTRLPYKKRKYLRHTTLSSTIFAIFCHTISFFYLPHSLYGQIAEPNEILFSTNPCPSMQTSDISDDIVLAQPTNNLESKNNIVRPAFEKTSSTPHQIDPFTGKIAGTKVRLRLLPNLDSVIVRELSSGELYVVTGETDEFYAVIPPDDVKGYIFRSYVLDGIVEGNNVNLRLKPDTQSPVLTQLSQGEGVDAKVCAENSKWFEVQLPPQLRLYVAKEYVQRVGDKSYFVTMKKKREELQKQVETLQKTIAAEFQKPFYEIQLASLSNQLKVVTAASTDFSDILDQINTMAASMQQTYLQLSIIAHEKSAAISSSTPYKSNNGVVETKMLKDITSSVSIQPDIQKQKSPSSFKEEVSFATFFLEQQEMAIIQDAIASQKATSIEDFYFQQKNRSHVVKGILIPYERVVKNRPGDFIIVDPVTQVSFAYVYSTKVPLKNYVGKLVSCTLIERPNHYFALPAYFALAVVESAP